MADILAYPFRMAFYGVVWLLASTVYWVCCKLERPKKYGRIGRPWATPPLKAPRDYCSARSRVCIERDVVDEICIRMAPVDQFPDLRNGRF